MFERISNGWQLAWQSWEVLKFDKELLMFPLLSGISLILVLASFGVPILLNIDHVQQLMENEDPTFQVLSWVGLFLFYFVNYFIIVFFNSALVACAIIRFRGGDPTVSDGLSAAAARLPQILGWAFVSATVGIILRAIESRSEKVGDFVAGLLGAAWSVTTYFVVPVIVIEKASPLKAFKRSLNILTRTWGESIVAGFSLGWITLLFSLLALLPLVLGGFLFQQGQIALGGVCIGVGVLGLLLVNLINSALEAILLGALYLYAADGEIPDQFDKSTFRTAFRQH